LLGVVSFWQSRIDESVRLMERSIAASADTAFYYRTICEIYRSPGR
jgi:hypothetical protein